MLAFPLALQGILTIIYKNIYVPYICHLQTYNMILESKIDLSNKKAVQEANTIEYFDEWVQDIHASLSDIDISGNKKIIVTGKYTKNFDSLYKRKILKNFAVEYLQGISRYIDSKSDKNKKGFNYNNTIIKKWKTKKKLLKYNNKNIAIIFMVLFMVIFVFKIWVETNINAGYNKILSIREYPGNAQKYLNDAKFHFIVGNFSLLLLE